MKAKTLCLLAVVLSLWSCGSEQNKRELDRLPKYTLAFDHLASSWDEAIPLGNGTVGALVWENDGKLRLSLTERICGT